MERLTAIFRREEGQDLAEYCLITALVALVAAGILLHVSGGIQNLWNAATQTTNSASAAISSGTSGDTTQQHH